MKKEIDAHDSENLRFHKEYEQHRLSGDVEVTLREMDEAHILVQLHNLFGRTDSDLIV